MRVLHSRGLQDEIIRLLTPLLIDRGYRVAFDSPKSDLEIPNDEDVDAYDDIIIISEHFPPFYTPLSQQEMVETVELALTKCRVPDIAQTNPITIVRLIRHLYRDPEEVLTAIPILTFAQEVKKFMLLIPILLLLSLLWLYLLPSKTVHGFALDTQTLRYHKRSCPWLHSGYEKITLSELKKHRDQWCPLCLRKNIN